MCISVLACDSSITTKGTPTAGYMLMDRHVQGTIIKHMHVNVTKTKLLTCLARPRAQQQACVHQSRARESLQSDCGRILWAIEQRNCFDDVPFKACRDWG